MYGMTSSHAPMVSWVLLPCRILSSCNFSREPKLLCIICCLFLVFRSWCVLKRMLVSMIGLVLGYTKRLGLLSFLNYTETCYTVNVKLCSLGSFDLDMTICLWKFAIITVIAIVIEWLSIPLLINILPPFFVFVCVSFLFFHFDSLITDFRYWKSGSGTYL